jgi:hypothetical protein
MLPPIRHMICSAAQEETLDPENDMRMINKLLEMLKKDEEFDKVQLNRTRPLTSRPHSPVNHECTRLTVGKGARSRPRHRRDRNQGKRGDSRASEAQH